MQVPEESWVITETSTSSFGDERLNKRYKKLLNSFTSSPNKSIPGTFKSWGETLAAYRFLNNQKVNQADILSPHKKATIERIKKESLVLIPQDTSTIDFSKRQPISGMGYLNDKKTQGFYIHPSLAVTSDKQPLGVIDFQAWVRKELGTRHTRKNRSIEEKESYCWIKSYEAANEIALAAPNTTIISIADREGDIYELLEKLPSESNKAYWLVRCQQNRLVINQETGEETRLWEIVKNTAPIGEIAFSLPAGTTYNRDKSKRKPRQERTVQQLVRAYTVQLKPSRRKGKKLNPIAINVIHCEEINPPNKEDKVEWFLLTSYPINTAKTALEAINWYLCRWQIELFFKVLKSGCTIEELQFNTYQATLNCVALYSIIAWRILYLTMLGRNCPNLPCDAVFERHEWQSVYAVSTKKPIPKQPPSLYALIIMIAKLGGFLARKSDGYPGSKVMWIGIQRMKDFAQAWEIFQSADYKNCV
jgi:hypothetical protein